MLINWMGVKDFKPGAYHGIEHYIFFILHNPFLDFKTNFNFPRLGTNQNTTYAVHAIKTYIAFLNKKRYFGLNGCTVCQFL